MKFGEKLKFLFPFIRNPNRDSRGHRQQTADDEELCSVVGYRNNKGQSIIFAAPNKLIEGEQLKWSANADKAGTGVFKSSFKIQPPLQYIKIRKFHLRNVCEYKKRSFLKFKITTWSS